MALVGVENVVVVATEDAVLVASKDHAESITRVVDYLKGNAPISPFSIPASIAPGIGIRASTAAIAIRSNASW